MELSLKELREKRGLSQAEVSEKIGISQSMLAMLETGERRGSDKVKVKLAKFYGVSVDSLFFANLYH